MTDHIPAEAIEAAAKAVHARIWPGLNWDDMPEQYRQDIRAQERAALSAALPFLRPEPSEDEREALGAIRTAQAKAMTEGDHVLADQLDAAARYVIATRRPMPSREEVAEAIARGLDGWNDFDDASADYQNELLSGADAVLALFEKGADRG